MMMELNLFGAIDAIMVDGKLNVVMVQTVATVAGSVSIWVRVTYAMELDGGGMTLT